MGAIVASRGPRRVASGLVALAFLLGCESNEDLPPEGGGTLAADARSRPDAPREPRPPPPSLAAHLGDAARHDFPPGLVFLHPAGWSVNTHPLASLVLGPQRGRELTENGLLTFFPAPAATALLSDDFVATVRRSLGPLLLRMQVTVAPQTVTAGEHTVGMMRWESRGGGPRTELTLYTLLEAEHRVSILVTCSDARLPELHGAFLALLASARVVPPRLDPRLVGRWRTRGGESVGEFDAATVTDLRADGSFVGVESRKDRGSGETRPVEGARAETGRWAAHAGNFFIFHAAQGGVWLHVGDYALEGTSPARVLRVTSVRREIIVYDEVR